MGETRTVTFTILGRLPGLNEFIGAERSNRYKGAQMKRDAQRICESAILEQLKGVRINNPVDIHFTFYELNKRRDHDNVSGFAHKVIQDALVTTKVLKDDGWDEVSGYDDHFFLDKENPRIVVTLEEITNG